MSAPEVPASCRWESYARKHASTPGARPGGLTAAEVVEWDVTTWAKALSFWRRHAGDDMRGATVLEVGGRDGGLASWFVQEGASKVICSDLSGPSEQAVSLHRDLLDAGVVEHRAIDSLDIPYDEELDIVVFKSVLGGIGGAHGLDGQRAAIHQMHKALRPGGVLLFAENLASSPVHAWARHRLVGWGSRWRYVTLDELRSMTAGFESVEWSSAGLLGSFGRTENQRSSLAHLDSAFLEWVVPRSWNYVGFGVARKAEA